MQGGSLVPRYVLQLLFSEKSQNYKKTQQALKLEKKSTDLESLEILDCFLSVRLNFTL